jgi:two-component system response regulator CssR
MKLLLAEDTRDLNRAVTAVLSHEGYQVDSVFDGTSALEHIRSDSFDVIILDIMMPGMNGYQVLKQIRREDPLLPVLFLSAKGSPADVSLGLDLGSDDYLPKPFDNEVLLSRVNALLRRARAAESSPARPEAPAASRFRLGAHVLDVRGHFVEDGAGERVMLTKRELDVLRILVGRMDEVVSREELFERCWGADANVTTRVLDQVTVSLRRKLGNDGALIETVHGAGLRIPIRAAAGG